MTRKRKGQRPAPYRPEDAPGVLVQNAVYKRDVYKRLAAIDVGGVRFVNESLDEEWIVEDGKVVAVRIGGTTYEKVETCTMEKTFDGTYNHDFTCTHCGKKHNAPRVNERCPRCGAYVRRAR